MSIEYGRHEVDEQYNIDLRIVHYAIPHSISAAAGKADDR